MTAYTGPVVGTVVCLPAKDLDRALDFYASVFALPALEAEGEMVVVELPNLSLFLIAEEEFASYSGRVGRGVQYPSAGTGVILSCAVESREALNAMLDAAAAHGGAVPNPPAADEELNLYLGYFFDPDGHHWELAVSER
ncbi:VOC family protein [Gulosibacter sp. 10]|uniref:VOC family protein n=1 Tax=Gulosibacter sp. 10 TaxID=1255570 RepID=UPI00097EE3E6|nr:VOC family protein [Gulosibacter sp. 10]SJM67155.1 Lactoylglutathione lyase [Gulosibacter sp. 10]